MFCPQCGQQQVSGVVRFCSRCGFPLDTVIQLLENGGVLPAPYEPAAAPEMSPRRRGVRQGGILLLMGALLVPILGVLSSYAGPSTFLDIVLAITAIVFFIGGPLRMLYAGVFEEGAPSPPSYAGSPVESSRPAAPRVSRRKDAALPPAAANPASGWRPRTNTAELVQPPSVTENTTRLLDNDEAKGR